VTLSVSFGSTPQWTYVPNTRVEQVAIAQRPSYDVFRYGGSYYAYSNDTWYRSSQQTGTYAMIAVQSVPSEIGNVPPANWRNYPANWRNGDGNNGNHNGNGNNGNGNGNNGNHGNGNGNNGNGQGNN
jgi:penicillin-binding protein 2A